MCVRFVQVMIPTGKREAILDVLDDEGIDYALSDETSHREYTAVVTFPLPTAAVEPVLDRLRESGIERDAYTVVLDAETVVSERFQRLQEEYESDEDASTDRIAREELIARAVDLAPETRTFVVMTAVSAVVATAGLLLDSPAVVVGSMVIAPLIGPAMATSVGTVVDDADLFRRGVRLQVAGGLLAVASAAIFAYVLQVTGIVPRPAAEVFAIDEVRERLAPDILALVVALGAGVAGALSLSSGVSAALVGVMIAVALVPPTAVVGIGLAWGEPSAVLGSAVLVVVNFFAINLTALGVLWLQGYRPERWFRAKDARTTTLKRIAILGVGLLLLSGFLGSVTYATYRTATFEEEARAGVEEVLDDSHAVLLSMDVEYEGFPVRDPERVVITVGYPLGTDPPRLGTRLAERVETARTPPPFVAADDPVTIEVQFVAIETVDGS